MCLIPFLLDGGLVSRCFPVLQMRKLRLREVKYLSEMVPLVSEPLLRRKQVSSGVLDDMDDWTVGVTSCPSLPGTLPGLAMKVSWESP